MSLRNTFLLMLLFLTLGSFAFFDPFGLKAQRETTKEKAVHVFWLKEKKAESFVIRRGDDTFRFECAVPEGCPFDGSGDWKLTDPVKDLADPSALGTVLSTIRALNVQEEIKLDGAPDPQEFGLGETRTAVEFRVKGEAEPYILTLGRAVPVGANVYAVSSRAPNTVYLVSNTVPILLKHDLFHWRNKRLFPGTKPDMVTRISWSTRGRSFRAERADQAWVLKEPVDGPASSILIDGLVSTLAYTNAKSIYAPAHSDPSAQKVLKTKPILVTSFGPSPETQYAMKVYAVPGAKPNANEFVAEASGLDPLFVVEGNPLERFQKDAGEYRDRRLFGARDVEPLDRMVFEFPRLKKSLTLERKGEAWVPTAGEPPAEPLSQSRVSRFAAALSTAEATDFAAAPSPAFNAFTKEKPDVTVIVNKGEKELARASFLVSEKRFAVTAGAHPKEVRRFGQEFLALLPVKPEDLYESANKRPATPPSEDPHGHHHDHGHAH